MQNKSFIEDKKTEILDAIDSFILSFKIVKDNIKSSYLKGFEDGSQSFELEKRNNEMLMLVKRIEQLKIIERDIDREQVEVAAKKMLNDLLSNVDLNSVLTVDKRGLVYVNGEQIDDAKLLNLKAEAESLAQFDLWRVLHETLKQLAHKAMFVSGEGLDDMKKGRSILYTLSAQQNIIDLLKSAKK